MAQPALDLSNPHGLKLDGPINVGSQEFTDRKFAYYEWMREEAPVCQIKVSVVKAMAVSRYDDCLDLLKDPRFVRNRTTATGGGSRLPFPMPKAMSFLAQSMIVEDDPEHRRLRGLVNQAFKPRAIDGVSDRLERLTNELLDDAPKQGVFDFMTTYAHPIPTVVIRELMGLREDEMPGFAYLMGSLSKGLTGLAVAKTVLWSLPRAVKFVRGVIARKRREPADDILTGLIEAEVDGERLTEEELISFVFLLVVAGFETTVHLVTNGMRALIEHPEQLDRLRADPELLDSAVEEMLRFCGPIHGTKMNFAREDVEWHGVLIPRGTPVVPALAAGNRDPRHFENPDTFDIARSPNRHLGFGHGAHFCLGAQLARMETRTAFKTLLERVPKFELGVPVEKLELQAMPFWHRHKSLPVRFG